MRALLARKLGHRGEPKELSEIVIVDADDGEFTWHLEPQIASREHRADRHLI
jgi:hypothetical protein